MSSSIVRKTEPLLLGLFGILLLIVIPWTLAVHMGVRSVILPPGKLILHSLEWLLSSNKLFGAAWISLVRVNVGFVCAVVTAVPLGILLGRSKRMFILAEPIVESFRFVIPFAWIPLVVL